MTRKKASTRQPWTSSIGWMLARVHLQLVVRIFSPFYFYAFISMETLQWFIISVVLYYCYNNMYLCHVQTNTISCSKKIVKYFHEIRYCSHTCVCIIKFQHSSCVYFSPNHSTTINISLMTNNIMLFSISPMTINNMLPIGICCIFQSCVHTSSMYVLACSTK